MFFCLRVLQDRSAEVKAYKDKFTCLGWMLEDFNSTNQVDWS
jgi:hypothetical protein